MRARRTRLRKIADVPDVEIHVVKPAGSQRAHHQALDLDVAFDAGVAVDLGADLQRLARAVHAVRQRVQHAARHSTAA